MASSLQTLAKEQQDEFLGFEETLRAELVDTYRSAAVRLGAEVGRVLERISEVRANGERVSEVWLYRQEWLLAMEESVIAELEQYGVYVESRITAVQHMATALGMSYTHDLLEMGVPGGLHLSFAGVSPAALEKFIGRTLHDGNPLSVALGKYPKQAADAIKHELAVGITLHQSPRKTARQISQVIGGASGDYLTLARTEVLNAHREAALATYRANSDVVAGWEWMLGRGDACPFCKSKVDTVYSLDTPFDTHPSCRCTAIPSLRGG